MTGLARDQLVEDQLEWADHVVAQGNGKIANPAGFYISVIRDNVALPESFETSSQRRTREETANAEGRARAEDARLRASYEGYLQGETNHHAAQLPPAEYEGRVAMKVEALTSQHATFANWGADQMRRIAETAVANDLHGEISYRLFDFTTFCRVQKQVDGPLGPPPRP